MMRQITATRFPAGPRRRAISWEAIGWPGEDLAWRADAACHDHPGDLFFPEPGPGIHAQIAEAKRVCAACPVRTTCLDYALTHDERAGIWGGLTEPQRRALRARHTPRRTPRPRDAEIARLSRLGLSAVEIARRLGITAGTVTQARARVRALGMATS